MQDKRIQYRGYLIVGLMLIFFLVGNITYTDAQGKSSATISSEQHELRDTEKLHSLKLDIRLVGTILASEENSYAVIEDETTGKQGLYKLGESIYGATVLKIDKDCIIVEKDRKAQVLKITGGSYTKTTLLEMLSRNVPPSNGASTDLGVSSAKNNPAFPVVFLPAIAQGERAIEVLGEKLSEVAAWYGSTPEEFSTMLREDQTAMISKGGHLFYVDKSPEHTAEDETPSVSSTSFPYDQTFKLHSLPGSKKVIYIDFDGHTTTGTVWNLFYGNQIISQAYDLDGNPSSFSNVELDRIQDIWKLVAEDYAPFDIDVTTEDPGQDAIARSSSSDERYGTRVVMTVDNFASCGCGGFAFVKVFDSVGSIHKPAFVFNKSLVGASEAVSHEAGHNLGLFHDGITGGTSYYKGQGSGATGWAPIMGVGYYKQLVQWSKGEYANANNTQDDIQIIQDNGAPLLADDYGNDKASATALDRTTDGNTVILSGNGLIERGTDVDYFSVMSGRGEISIDVGPSQFSPNLDVLVELYDSSGTLIASSNSFNSLSASINETALPAGKHFIMVDGVGKGDPQVTGYSDYASLGKYTISGSVPIDTSPTVTAITTGDIDGNGKDDLIIDFGNTIGLYIRYDNGSWAKIHTFSPEIMAIGDVDGNGQDDIILGFGDPWGTYIRYNDANWVGLHSSTPKIMATGDVDGNGKDDIILGFGDPWGTYIRYNDANWVGLHSSTPQIMATGDVDGNGKDDIVLGFGDPWGTYIKYNDTNWAWLHSSTPQIMATGDVDGNGKDDIILGFGDPWGTHIRYNDTNWAGIHSSTPQIMATGDLDGSGQDEIILGFGNSVGLYSRYNNSSWVKVHTSSPEAIATGDLDGNGQDDIILDFSSSSVIYMLINNSTWNGT